MEKSLKYPTADRIIEYNLLALTIIKVKKADRSDVLSRQRIDHIIKECKELKGDLYDKAVCLFKGITHLRAETGEQHSLLQRNF